MSARANKALTAKLAVVVVAMFGFGYLLVPLYDLFCEITGVGGRTGTVTEQAAAGSAPDVTRDVTVEFTAATAPGLPWEFRPLQRKMTVHPGAVTEVFYLARSKSRRATAGQAVPSVAPFDASRHFKKIECFCFTNQQLAPFEERKMAVRFVVDRELPPAVHTVTLSYMFYNVDAAAGLTAAAAGEKT